MRSWLLDCLDAREHSIVMEEERERMRYLVKKRDGDRRSSVHSTRCCMPWNETRRIGVERGWDSSIDQARSVWRLAPHVHRQTQADR